MANGAVSYGGVVFGEDGRVLLREPTGHFGGYAWTFAKGRPEPGETPGEAALREVQEEMGVQAAIVACISDSFRGGTGETVYFLMRPLAISAFDREETAAIRWATPEEAAALIGQTRNSVGRARDLVVLQAAVAAAEHA